MTAPGQARLTYIGCALLLLMPLAVTPVLPMIDFYNHIARFYILSHIGQNAVFAANYAAAWQLLPNLGLDVIGTPLLALVPPLAAAKLLVGAILLVQFSGVLFLHRALNRAPDVLPAALLLGLLYSYILTWGFGNFLLALGLVFWNLGLWVRLRERPLAAVAACALGGLVIFFCHGFAFAIYGVLVTGLELGRWLQGGGRRRPAILLRRAGLLAAQAVMPALLFLNMPTSIATGKTGSTLSAIQSHAGDGSLAARLDFEFWYRLRTIARVAESPYLLLDVVTVTLAATVILLALWKGWFRLHAQARAPLLIVAALCVVVPPALFGVGYLSDRLPLAFALLLIAALATARPLPKGGQVALAALAALALVRIAAVTIGWSAYAGHYADFRQVISVIPRGALVTDLMPSGSDHRDGLMPRCQMYRPLAIALNGDAAPLFAFASQQPIRLAGPLAAAQGQVSDAPDMRIKPSPGYFDDALAGIARSARFDYVIMCGRERLTRPLPPGVSVAAERGGISVLKIH